MVSEKVIIQNPTGLHLRPAGLLCQEALKYDCKIKFKVKDQLYNAKSVLSVLGAGVKCGYELEFICDGSDEQKALEAMITLVKNGLGD